MARLHFVKQARKDNQVVKKGESYFWWKFRFGGKHYSKAKPKRSLLTESSFLGGVWDIEDTLTEAGASGAAFEDIISDATGEIECLGEEAQSALDNMPDSLQSGPTGELLQGRVDACEEWVSELEDIDLDIDDDLDDEEKEAREEEILEEIQASSYNGE